jgi:hypothetical protein
MNKEYRYHPDYEIEALIELSVKLAIKYVKHVQHIKFMHDLDSAAQNAMKSKERKDAMEIVKILDHNRSKKAPDFSAEASDFVRAVSKWCPAVTAPELPEVAKKHL